MKQYVLTLAVLVSAVYPLAATANTREAPPVVGTDRAIPHGHGGGGRGGSLGGGRGGASGGRVINENHVMKTRDGSNIKVTDVGGGADTLEKKKKYGCRSVSCY